MTQRPAKRPSETRRPRRRRLLTAASVFAALCLPIIAFAWSQTTPRPSHLQPKPLDYRIPVNHADPETLCLLPGVGPRVAGNIIEHRQSLGPLTSPDQLEQIKRIGPKTRQRMQAWVRFD